MRGSAAPAVPALTPLLKRDSPDLTRCVIGALGAIGTADALRALRAELAAPAFQRETLNALAMMHDRCGAGGRRRPALLTSTNR